MSVTRHPLTWPVGWKRTGLGARVAPRWHRIGSETKHWGNGTSSTWRTKRDLSVADATDRLLAELDRLGARDVLLSTNLELRLDGLPRSNQRRPDDPGAAVYFKLNKADRCLACDRYTTVEGNIAALAAHVEALRAIDRYGVGSVDQAFAGYTALPADTSESWWQVLGVPPDATRDAIDQAYRRMARELHPDVSGHSDAMVRLNQAVAAARRVRA